MEQYQARIFFMNVLEFGSTERFSFLVRSATVWSAKRIGRFVKEEQVIVGWLSPVGTFFELLALLIFLLELFPLLALLIFENSLNIFSQIGIIILMGISAKNGILIVEFARQLKSVGKKSYESLISACKIRFRPIIMTGISTVVGVIPLVIGSGAGYESRLTIGIVLISGIIFSIFLTLFITPFFFKIIDRD